MNIFKRDRNNIQSIAFMAIMAAVNVALVLVTTFVPFLFFLCVLILPLSSLLVTITCKKYFFPLYLIVTSGICLVSTLWDISNVFLYVIPSIISGFIFGICIEKKFPPILLIFLPTLVYFGFTYLSFPIVKGIYGFDIVENLLKIFGLQSKEGIKDIIPSFIYLISLIQAVFSYIVIYNESKKIQIEIKETNKDYIFSLIVSILFLITMIIMAFFSLSLAFFFMLIFITFALFCIIKSLSNLDRWVIILYAICALLTLFIVAIFYNKLPNKYGLLLISSFFVLALIVSFIKYSLLKREEKIE